VRLPGLPSYERLLTWAVTLCSSARVLSYLPTLWTVHGSGSSSQHSLWTWGTWVAANLTMAAWLYETNDRRVDRVIAVNGANAAMCLVTFLWIAALR
jgi:hypothetical protein